jgi:hypothetical protein
MFFCRRISFLRDCLLRFFHEFLRFEVTGYIQKRQGHWEESTGTLDHRRFFNATYCEFGRKFSELTVSFLRPIPESEDRCGFDPTPDRAGVAQE